MKIYMYFIGNDKEKNEKKNKIKKTKIEIGPSKEEHQYLLNNFYYYKKNFDLKKYAFCSDLWRIYKLSMIDNGIYLDFYSLIDETQNNWINNLDKNYNYFFVELEGTSIWNGMIIKNKSCKIFEDVLNFYKKKNSFSLSGPQILTKILIKKKYVSLNLKVKNNSLKLLNTKMLDSRVEKQFIKINSQASWNNLNNPMQLWFDKWDNKKKRKSFIYKILVYKCTWIYCILLKVYLLIFKKNKQI